MDEIERAIVNRLQGGFPLAAHPFAPVGLQGPSRSLSRPPRPRVHLYRATMHRASWHGATQNPATPGRAVLDPATPGARTPLALV